MTKTECADVKDLLPERIRRGLGEGERAVVDAHVASCASCSAEAEFLKTIQNAAFAVPDSFASDIKSALAAEARASGRWAERAAERAPERRSRWRLPVAATVILALGTGLIWQRMQALPDVGPLGQEPFAVVWPSDDADVAGVPMLDDLSDDDLALLLEELGG